MLTVPNHDLLLHVPRNVLQEAAVRDISRDCSEADHALFEDGCNVCLSSLVGDFPQPFKNYSGLTTILASTLSTVGCSLCGPMEKAGKIHPSIQLGWIEF